MLLTALPPAPPTPNTVMRGASSLRCSVCTKFNAIAYSASFIRRVQTTLRAVLSDFY